MAEAIVCFIVNNLGCLKRNGALFCLIGHSDHKDIIMIKDILQKNQIKLGMGLMVLVVNQGFARPPSLNQHTASGV